MDDMNLRVLNNAISILCFYGLFYRIYLPNGQDIEFPPQTTHFAIKGVNALLVTQSGMQSTVLLGMGVSTDVQSQGTCMSGS